MSNLNKDKNGQSRKVIFSGSAAIAVLLSLLLITPMHAFAGTYTGGYPNKGVIHNIERVSFVSDLGGTDYNALDCVYKSLLDIAGTTGTQPSGWTYIAGISIFKAPTCTSSGDYFARTEVWDLGTLKDGKNIAPPQGYDRTNLDDTVAEIFWNSDRTQVTFKFSFTNTQGVTQVKTYAHTQLAGDTSNNFMNGVTLSDNKLIKFMQYGAEGSSFSAFLDQDGWIIKQKDIKFYTTEGKSYDLRNYYNYATRQPDAWITYRGTNYVTLGDIDSTHTQATANHQSSQVPKGEVTWFYVGSDPITTGTKLWNAQGGIGIYAEDCSGSNYINGLAVHLYDSVGNLVQSGFTPMYVDVHTAGNYLLKYNNYGSNIFVSAGPNPPVTSVTQTTWGGEVNLSLVSDQRLDVDGVYNTSGGTACGSTGSINVKSTDLSGNTIIGMYVQLQDSNGVEINNGFTEITWPNLTPASYTVYANDYCDSGTGENRVFNSWSDGTTTRGKNVSVQGGSTTSVTAKYSITTC